MTTNTPKRISELEASDAIQETDITAVVRPGSGLNTRKATVAQVLQPVRDELGTMASQNADNVAITGGTFPSTVVLTSGAQTLTNKTLTAPVFSGTIGGTYTIGGTPTFPSSVVLDTATQTLTNKTLTAPVFGGTITGTYTLGGSPTFPSTVVQTTASQTLTNKTLSSPTINGTVVGTPTISGMWSFVVAGDAAFFHNTNSSGWASQFRDGGSNATMQFLKSDGNAVGSITHNGTNASYNTSSDYRLKHDFMEWGPEDAMSFLESVLVYDHAWLGHQHRSIGVIAHELQELAPDAVHGEKDAVDSNGAPVYQGVDYSKLVPRLLVICKVLAERITALEGQNND